MYCKYPQWPMLFRLYQQDKVEQRVFYSWYGKTKLKQLHTFGKNVNAKCIEENIVDEMKEEAS